MLVCSSISAATATAAVPVQLQQLQQQQQQQQCSLVQIAMHMDARRHTPAQDHE
jgi:hypothetical protein